jgi:hypothetical protein
MAAGPTAAELFSLDGGRADVESREGVPFARGLGGIGGEEERTCDSFRLHPTDPRTAIANACAKGWVCWGPGGEERGCRCHNICPPESTPEREVSRGNGLSGGRVDTFRKVVPGTRERLGTWTMLWRLEYWPSSPWPQIRVPWTEWIFQRNPVRYMVSRQ